MPCLPCLFSDRIWIGRRKEGNETKVSEAYVESRIYEEAHIDNGVNGMREGVSGWAGIDLKAPSDPNHQTNSKLFFVLCHGLFSAP
jgi:hypothetical protein